MKAQMHEDFFRALEAGATVVSASRRLARTLTQAYHTSQREQGRAVWRTPDILPLDAFLERAWREHVLRGRRPCAALLDALQEQAIWEQVIRESPAGDSLLLLRETARQAMDAWQLIQAYRLPVDGRFEASDDWAAFAKWSREFRKRRAANDWLEPARLADEVADLAKTGELALPATLLHAGFEEITPQQSDLFAALGLRTAFESPSYAARVERWKFRDNTEEIRAAAKWARRLVEQNPVVGVGVVVPNLTNTRAKVERILRESFDPGGRFDDHERAFHVSLGPPLDQYPAISAALLILELASGALTLPRAGMLLRSPFLDGAETERTKRAQLDAKLRKDGVWDVSPAILRDRADRCPVLGRVVARFEKERRKLSHEQPASAWSRDFSKLAEALGWPGERSLSSREYQVVEKWNGMLTSLAALEVATPPLGFTQALARLREIGASSTFQVENADAPVQIMGLLEASGLRFDHLWVMGLHDEAMPAGANPNPFLPISLQREYKLPHSSAQGELEFARNLMGRLLASARDVVLSYPASEGDRSLGPSPLVAGGPWREASEKAQPLEWVARMRAAAMIEELQDEIAPPVAEESMQTGGASLFKDMAACPFRAFAKHRLGARPLEEGDPGLSYRDRGNAAHRALALVWSELASHTRLMELPPEELRELIARGVNGAVERLGRGVGRKLEQRRLERLLGEWVEIEKLRDPFAVHAVEEERMASLGGLQVRTRADRVDRLPDGREIILDYKTGKVKLTWWQGDRPDEPQLPLYCATSAEPIAGAAIALIRIGEMGFRGRSEAGAALPAMKEMRVDPPVSFRDQMDAWRIVLEHLAVDFRAGRGEVDPKPEACEHCGLRALCRIRELEHGRG